MTNWKELLELAEQGNHTAAPELMDENEWSPDLSDVRVGQAEHWSHDQKALAYAHSISKRYRYIPEHNSWVKWNGHVWEIDPAGASAVSFALRTWMHPQIAAYAAETEEQMSKAGVDEREIKEAVRKIYNAYGNRAYQRHILGFTEEDPRIVTPLTKFDANPYVLNTPGGLYDLRTGSQVDAAAPLVLRSTNVAPDASGDLDGSLWGTFLDQTFSGDGALIEYVQKMLGASLLGAQTEQTFQYMHGEGANGKDTMANIIQGIVGIGDAGYSTHVDSAMFVGGKYQAHPEEIAKFAGVRLAFTSEVPKGAKADTAKLKKLTGGGYLSGRFMRGNSFTFEASHSLWVMANDRLQVDSSDKAFFRRLREIPFLNIVPSHKRILGLDKRIIREEGGLVLRWIIDGAVAYLRDGLDIPVAIQMANDAYVDENKHAERFLAERCHVTGSDEDFILASSLRKEYVAWCKQEGLTVKKAEDFKADILTVSGVRYSRKGKNGLRGYSGIQIPGVNVTV